MVKLDLITFKTLQHNSGTGINGIGLYYDGAYIGHFTNFECKEGKISHRIYLFLLIEYIEKGITITEKDHFYNILTIVTST